MIQYILIVFFIIISITICYFLIKQNREDFGIFNWTLSKINVRAPYNDGTRLSAEESLKPSNEICKTSRKYSIGSNVFCGLCPEGQRCGVDVNEPCKENEDCIGFTEGKTACCKGICKNLDGKLNCPISKLGEKCRLDQDCAGVGNTFTYDDKGKKITQVKCCTPEGTDVIGSGWGICTKPGISNGVGWCPQQPDHPKFEVPLGARCEQDSDCEGGKATGCCQKRCVRLDSSKKCPKAKLGQFCKIDNDCLGSETGSFTQDSRGIKYSNVVCCKPDGTDNDGIKWGVCTIPCVKNGRGHCPYQTKNMKCEKKIGERCEKNEDCIGHGFINNGIGTLCCDNKCVKNPHQLIECPYSRGQWLDFDQKDKASIYCKSGKTYLDGLQTRCA